MAWPLWTTALESHPCGQSQQLGVYVAGAEGIGHNAAIMTCAVLSPPRLPVGEGQIPSQGEGMAEHTAPDTGQIRQTVAYQSPPEEDTPLLDHMGWHSGARGPSRCGK